MGYIVESEQNTIISKDSKIGDGSIIRFGSIIEDDVEIGKNCTIGPYAHIHTHTKIGDNCIVGNFVEIKNSVIDANCKAKHLVYIGDCVCGKNVNFGCGVVIANYNGKEKNKTIIKDNVFIGCNSNLVAPLLVGNNVFLAAGTTVKGEIKDNSFIKEEKNIIYKINKFIK